MSWFNKNPDCLVAYNYRFVGEMSAKEAIEDIHKLHPDDVAVWAARYASYRAPGHEREFIEGVHTYYLECVREEEKRVARLAELLVTARQIFGLPEAS